MAGSGRRKSISILWLMPAPAGRNFFRATIRRFAQRYDAPSFEPHLTLGVSAGTKTLPQLTAPEPITLRPVGIFFSSRFTKTLFVRFEITPALQNLRRTLGLSGAAFDPHLSLLYRKLPGPEKAQLAALVSLPFSTVTFDRIALVQCVSPTQNRADVEAWQLLAVERLRSAARKASRSGNGKVSRKHKQTGNGIRRKE